MAERTTHWTFEDLSPEHRDLAIKGAAEEEVTVKVWMERAIAEHGRRSAAGGESVAESASEAISAGAYGAHRTASHAHLHDEGEVEARETVRRRETLREAGGERIEDGLSTYHSRVASRAAAAEAVPVNIWLEEAVVERARRGERERVHHPHVVEPAPVVAPAATTVVEERRSGDRGFELVAAMLAGILVASLLILAVAWFGARPPWVFGGGDGGAGGGGKVMVVTPANGATPGYAAPFGANVSVTTEVNTSPQTQTSDTSSINSAPGPGPKPVQPGPGPHQGPAYPGPCCRHVTPCCESRSPPCCYRPHPRPPSDCGCRQDEADAPRYIYEGPGTADAPPQDRGDARSDDGLDGR